MDTLQIGWSGANDTDTLHLIGMGLGVMKLEGKEWHSFFKVLYNSETQRVVHDGSPTQSDMIHKKS